MYLHLRDLASLVELVSFAWAMLVKVAWTQLATVEHREAFGTLASIPTLLVTTSDQIEVTRDPLQHERHEDLADHAGDHDLLSQLIASSVHVNDIGGNAQFAKLRALLRVLEDTDH